MALSSVSYLGDGSNKIFSVTFLYLAKAHVKVYVAGVETTDYTWLTASSISITTAPASLAIVLIKRVTPTTPIVDFVDGSTLTESLLDTSSLQGLYVVEEGNDSLVNAMALDTTDNKYEANSKVIKNVANPVNPQDVATKSWSESAVTASVAQAATSASNANISAVNSAASASTASTQAGIATTKASEATTQAGIATTKASEASLSALDAAASASTATIKAGEVSSSVITATTQAGIATTQAGIATTQAGIATVKASEAAASALAASLSAASVDLTTRVAKTSDTGSAVLPSGTTAQRDVSPVAGYIRYNSTTASFEVYGTAWGSIISGGEIGSTIQAYDADTAKTDVVQTFTAGQRGEVTALTDGTNIASDFNDSNFFSVTLSGNRTLDNPSNLVAGQSGSIFITQDATGSRTLAYGSYWDFAKGVAPSLSTAANTVDRLDYVVRTSTSIHAVLTKAWS